MKKKSFNLSYEFCDKQEFPYLLPLDNLGCKASQITFFVFTMSACEQHHLLSSINFAMHKVKSGTPTAGSVKINFKVTIEKSVASDNPLSFIGSIKEILAYWKRFLNDVLAVIK